MLIGFELLICRLRIETPHLPVNRRSHDVPGTGLSAGYPLLLESAGTGGIQAFQRSYGGGQQSVSPPGRVHPRTDHLQEGKVQTHRLLRCELGSTPVLTSSYIVILANGPIRCKMGIKGLTVRSAMEAELVTAALTTIDAVLQ